MSLDYNRLSTIVFLLWDNEADFTAETTQLRIGNFFKNKHRIFSSSDLETIINTYDKDQEFLFLIHLDHSNDKAGYYSFLGSKIMQYFPNLNHYYVSRASRSKIFENNEPLDVYSWDNYLDKIDSTFLPQTKNEMKQNGKNITEMINGLPISNENNFPQCDYAIITALEEDEMEKILPMIQKDGETSNTKHLIEYGHLIKNPSKKIAYASQQSTGMIDAAILATELLNTFKPKFLIMPGVLGGKPNEVSIGDIIVSTKVFTIDKGKLTTEEILNEESVKEQIAIVENVKKVFKKEIESVTMNSSAITKFIRNKNEILSFINNEDQTRKRKIDLLFGPIACVRQVIDQKGYFEENVLLIDRKAVGLEMESYSIARACELVNNGVTTPIIVKSVMDNTMDKVDDAKTYAAWTSAMFVKYILENDLI